MPGNPVLPVYAADPDLQLVGDRYHLYATHAGFYPDREAFEGGRPTEAGHGFAAWSSRDLREWRSDGTILRFADVAWARDLRNAWAPCLAARNGRFYLYFCADSRIGVAVSDSPTGPFADALGRPLVPYRDDLSAIDPMAFVDDDGQAYLYWGAVPGFWLEGRVEYVRMHLSVRRLAPDMTRFVGEEMPTVFTRRWRDDWHDLDHIEASHVLKRNGTYSLMWSEGSFSSPDPERSYRVRYATSASPLGPWHHAPEPILGSRPEIGAVGPGHHGVVRIPGTDEWWCAYHCHPGDADRRVWIDRITFDEAGRVEPVVPTLEGPPARPLALGLRLEGTGPFSEGEPIDFRIAAHAGVERVELFSGGTRLGECAPGEPVWRWEAPLAGFHRVRAQARTPDGRPLASAEVDLDVV